MGTNYYVNLGNDVRFHIGKSSAGWAFGLHIDEYHVHNINEALTLLYNYPIEDEYGNSIPLSRMLRIIFSRHGNARKSYERFRSQSWIPKTFDDYLDANHAVYDEEYGLLRSKIDGSHCIGHGDGPYDLIKGEFS